MEISKEELIEIIDHIIDKVNSNNNKEYVHIPFSQLTSASTEVKNPCESCPDYKPGKMQTCWCTLPTMVEYTVK